MDQSLDSLSFFFPTLPLPNQFRRDQARKQVDVIFKRIIQKRRASGAEALNSETDLVATLVSATLDDGSKLTDDQIVGMMIGVWWCEDAAAFLSSIAALLIAGQHTSNVTGTWLGINLLQSPDAMARARQELERCIGGAAAESAL